MSRQFDNMVNSMSEKELSEFLSSCDEAEEKSRQILDSKNDKNKKIRLISYTKVDIFLEN